MVTCDPLCPLIDCSNRCATHERETKGKAGLIESSSGHSTAPNGGQTMRYNVARARIVISKLQLTLLSWRISDRRIKIAPVHFYSAAHHLRSRSRWSSSPIPDCYPTYSNWSKSYGAAWSSLVPIDDSVEHDQPLLCGIQLAKWLVDDRVNVQECFTAAVSRR